MILVRIGIPWTMKSISMLESTHYIVIAEDTFVDHVKNKTIFFPQEGSF